VNIEQFHSHQSESSMVNQLVGSAFEVSQAHSEHHVESFVDDPVAVSLAVNETMLLQRKGGKSTTDTQSAKGSDPTNAHDEPGARGLIILYSFSILFHTSFFFPNSKCSSLFSFTFDGVH